MCLFVWCVCHVFLFGGSSALNYGVRNLGFLLFRFFEFSPFRRISYKGLIDVIVLGSRAAQNPMKKEFQNRALVLEGLFHAKARSHNSPCCMYMYIQVIICLILAYLFVCPGVYVYIHPHCVCSFAESGGSRPGPVRSSSAIRAEGT